MASSFLAEVEEIMGVLLTQLGFSVDSVDDRPDAGGISRNIIYYRSGDCKLQVYRSSREGEVNCMIAPLDAANSFGLQTPKWQFLTRFAKHPDIPLEELVEMSRTDYESYGNALEWLRDRIAQNYEAAHSGIIKMYGNN